MTISEKVKNTPLNERPKIQVNNEAPRFMNDLEFEEYLNFMEQIAEMPKPEPTPEQRIAELEAQFAALTDGYAEGVNQA